VEKYEKRIGRLYADAFSIQNLSFFPLVVKAIFMASSNRLVVIGLDGMSFFQARFAAKEFGLDNLKYLTDSTNCRSITSELPELSPVNWTSFFTGKGPEEHGVFGFVNIDPKTYQIYLTDFTKVKTRTIFSKLSEKNVFSKVINVPNTYPAPYINGIIISGFVARDLNNAVFPKFFIPILKDINYRLEPDTIKGIKDPEYLISEIFLTMDSRKRAFDLLWPDLAWDLFIFVITEIDRINHFMYPAIFDKKNRFHSMVKEFFKKLDQIIGDIIDRYNALPDPKRMIVVADHGFCELITEVDINVILKNAGFLKLDGKSKTELDANVISDKSIAFALDPGRIYIHKKGIYSKGKVTDNDYPKVINDIKELLKEITYKNKKVFKEIYFKEEIYPGSNHIDTPDILCVPNKGFDLKAKFNRNHVFGNYGRFGTHFYEDAIFFDSQDEKKAKKVRDVGNIIIEHFEKRIIK